MDLCRTGLCKTPENPPRCHVPLIMQSWQVYLQYSLYMNTFLEFPRSVPHSKKEWSFGETLDKRITNFIRQQIKILNQILLFILIYMGIRKSTPPIRQKEQTASDTMDNIIINNIIYFLLFFKINSCCLFLSFWRFAHPICITQKEWVAGLILDKRILYCICWQIKKV